MAETITMPKLGFDMQEGTLVRWVRNEGEDINKGDVLAEIETDKATVEVESSASGVIRKLLVDQGAIVPIGAAIAIVGTKDEKIIEPTPVSTKKAEIQKQTSAPSQIVGNEEPLRTENLSTVQPLAGKLPMELGRKQKASPLARKLARDELVDLTRIKGSGPGGRIVRRDIEAVVSSTGSTAKSGSITSMSVPLKDETIALSRLRQAIARRMAESKISAPHFYVTHEFRMDAIIGLREQINEFLPEDEKLSVNDFVLKAVALALREFPNLNASFNGASVVRHGAINIGVAVAVENGLLTVVGKDADQKPLRQLSMEIKRMAEGARQGKVRPEEIEGSTFSISNLGMYDVENFIAILNPPEAAILAVGSARQVPVVEDGEIKIGWRMKSTISVDHRVSDGAEAARFMQTLATCMETPIRFFV